MATATYYYADNTVGIEVVSDNRDKKSEAFAELRCDNCHGTHISTEIQNDVLIILCNSCDNYWTGDLAVVLHVDSSGQAFTDFNTISFSNTI